MRVLITGGFGFIGITLAKVLVELDYEVTLLDSLTVQVHGEIPAFEAPAGVKCVRMDVRELADRPEVLEGMDVVYHLAAETGTAQSMYRVVHYVDVNEVGTAALIEGIGKCVRRPKHVVLASSRSVYGEGAYVHESSPGILVVPQSRTKEQLVAGEWEPVDGQGRVLTCVPTPENLGFFPGSIYAASKAAQELLLQAASTALGFRLSIFRFQNVYGEGQSLQNPYTGIISIFFNRAAQGIEIPIYEDGRESRDFVHVSDIVWGLVNVVKADLPSATVMNLGAGQPTSVLSLVDDLLAATGCNVPVRVTGQFRLGDIRHCYADTTRAKTLLGYSPQVSLREGLRRFAAWASSQPRHDDKLEKATEELRKKGLAV